MYITLALRSGLSELVSHERIAVLHLLQELIKVEVGSGFGIEPFKNLNLFLALKAKNTDLAQLM